MPPNVLSSMESAPESDQMSMDDKSFVTGVHGHVMEFNRVNCLVWVLHESARGFSLAIQALELARTGPELAMAWTGVDVHAWHKNMAYQVCQIDKEFTHIEQGKESLGKKNEDTNLGIHIKFALILLSWIGTLT